MKESMEIMVNVSMQAWQWLFIGIVFIAWAVIDIVWWARTVRRYKSVIADLERTLDSVRADRDSYVRGFSDNKEAYNRLYNKYTDIQSNHASTVLDLAEATARIRVLEGQLKAEREKVTATDLRSMALISAVGSAPDTVDGSVIAENAKLFYRFLSGRA